MKLIASHQSTPDSALIPVGISACLLGEPVRFNGGHKQSKLCLQQLSQFFDFKPFCPEVAIGLGVPRRPIRLVGDPDSPRAVGTDNPDLDVTEPLRDFARDQQPQLQQLAGYILMKNSPSCGMERVKIYQDNGYPHRQSGSGLFAAELMEANPLLPVEEEGRLHDPILCENFVMRVLTFHQWQQLLADGITAKSLIEFHSRHKYLLMAHDQEIYHYLGKLLANLKKADLQRLADCYIENLMKALRRPATRKTHSNVMLHLLGYLKRSLDQRSRQQLLDQINLYRQGQIPLIAVMTLLNHFLVNLSTNYIRKQRYLQPHPQELGLRNRI
ncbi:MAG: DUF523 and DUF1722 domain-containing protein [Motiliproteus sp.]|nr:DUF523 and DUF1722 domain-containing protein [Motiliproteus sp.]MCW9053698.1 DUF523 and DUF1722 domain-containing protein [Motiliproteus sp.]